MTVFVPAAAAVLAVKVNVPPAAELVGLNAAVTPLGEPEADRLTLPVKPFSVLTVIWLVLLPPGVTARVADEAERLKSGVALVPAVTLRLSVTVRVRPPPVPTMVTVAGLELTGVVLPAVKVSVLVLVALAGLNNAVTPLGRSNADRFTLLSKPLPGMMATVIVTLAPCLTVRSFTDVPMTLGTVSEKFGAELVPARASIVACPRGLPQPVQRS